MWKTHGETPGKSSTNGRFSTSMLVSRRVIIDKPMKLPFKAGMMVARIGDFG
jgi:hypothetical protein